jgi:epidermal growth factor receptor substrate 15
LATPGELAEHIPGGFPGHEGPFTSNTEAEPVPGAFPDELPQPEIAAQELSGPSTTTATPSNAPATGKDDFDSAFAGFGNADQSTTSRDPFATDANENSKPQSKGLTSEFPPIQNLDLEDDSDSDSDDDDDSEKGFGDNFTGAPPAKQNGTAAVQANTATPAPPVVTSDESAAARPEIASTQSAASVLPAAGDAQSPPTYEESDEQVHGGNVQRSSSNQFPPEFGGLLPAREDPTTGSAPALEPPTRSDTDQSLQTPQTSLFPHIGTPASATGTEFHDARSRPVSTVPDVGPAASQPQVVAAPVARDEFDDFDDLELAEAKEADKSGSDADFGFGNHSRDASEFNGAFDSPAASMTTTMADSHPTPRQAGESNGFSGFSPSASVSSPVGGESAPHDWDAIFSGLDNSATGNIDTSFGGSTSNDPWETNGTPAATHKEVQQPTSPQSTTTAKPIAPALTPGEEHDDPILKRLTGMGYNRAQALDALEKYDYDINRASLHI